MRFPFPQTLPLQFGDFFDKLLHLLIAAHGLANPLLPSFGNKDTRKRIGYSGGVDTRRRVLGPEHPQTLVSMLNLADTLTKMGQYEEAENMLKQTLEIQRRVLGP